MPNRIAAVNVNSSGPPQISSGMIEMAVAPLVSTVRDSVWLVERLMRSPRDMRL
jgi:hypothetical protein